MLKWRKGEKDKKKIKNAYTVNNENNNHQFTLLLMAFEQLETAKAMKLEVAVFVDF